MRRKNLLGVLFLSACLAGGSIVPVSADSMRVVTLGADLSEEQKNTMLRYFNVSADEVQIMYITNQDEIEHLSDYVPLAQIGSRTVSCAYVRPTSSGGIKVRTANLNWVTGNMIASSLSTSGVKNCEVIAACPFEVSGTGALTGIQMAYETATGTQLDSAKKEVATKEIVVTGNLADNVGIKQATTIINESKKEVIQNNIQNNTDINNVVNNVVQQNNVNVNSEQLDEIVSLLEEIAQQGYEYDDVKDTIEQVEENVMGGDDLEETEEPSVEDPDMTETEEPAEDEDSIMDDVNTDALGEDVKQSSTEDPNLENETNLVTEDPAAESQESGDGLEGDDGWEVFDDEESAETETESSEGGEEWTVVEENTEENTETPEAEAPAEEGTETSGEEQWEVFEENGGSEGGETVIEENQTEYTEPEGGVEQPAEETTETGEAAAENDLSVLTEDQQTKYTKAERFFAGEYEGDAAALQEATEDPAAEATVVLDTETGKQLTEKVKNTYYGVLKDGAMTYVPDGTEVYMNTELNMMNTELKKLFSIDGQMPADGADILVNVSQEDKQVLYNDTLKFFEKLYGESIAEIGGAEGATDVYVEDTSMEGEGMEDASMDGMEDVTGMVDELLGEAY